jgi:hypothetical protein
MPLLSPAYCVTETFGPCSEKTENARPLRCASEQALRCTRFTCMGRRTGRGGFLLSDGDPARTRLRGENAATVQKPSRKRQEGFVPISWHCRGGILRVRVSTELADASVTPLGSRRRPCPCTAAWPPCPHPVTLDEPPGHQPALPFLGLGAAVMSLWIASSRTRAQSRLATPHPAGFFTGLHVLEVGHLAVEHGVADDPDRARGRQHDHAIALVIPRVEAGGRNPRWVIRGEPRCNRLHFDLNGQIRGA